MAPRLNSTSKSLLLKQTLQSRTKSSFFIKLLAVNRSFIHVGNYYNISQLVIDMSDSDVSIFFGTDHQNRTKNFHLSAEQTRKLIELFHIYSLKIKCPSYEKGQFLEYCSLIDSVEGKIDLDFTFKSYCSRSCVIQVLNSYWEKITNLRGSVNLFRFSQPRTHFDKLVVIGIDFIDDLKNILHHDVDELEIKYRGNLSMSEVEEFLETSQKTQIKKCKLIRNTEFGEIDVIVPLVRLISEISPSCQKIEVDIPTYSPIAAITEECLINDIVKHYELFNKAKHLLGVFPFKLALCVSISYFLFFSHKESEWFGLLRQKEPAFLDSTYNMNLNGRAVLGELVLQSVNDSLRSKFMADIFYYD